MPITYQQLLITYYSKTLNHYTNKFENYVLYEKNS
jgi:hypothetical protein